jgi:hypothetical protein
VPRLQDLRSGTWSTVAADGSTMRILTPSTKAEFDQVDGFSPDYFWPCQEASGNLASTIGSLTLTAAGAGAHLYQQAITSWTRKAVGSTADADVCAWRDTAAAANVLDPTAGSVAWSAVLSLLSNPAANRIVWTMAATAPNLLVSVTTTGKLRLTCNAVNADSLATFTGIGPFYAVVEYNKTTGVCKLWTPLEVVTVTYAATASNSNKGIGNVSGVGTGIYRFLSVAGYQAHNAERDWYNVVKGRGWPMAYAHP